MERKQKKNLAKVQKKLMLLEDVKKDMIVNFSAKEKLKHIVSKEALNIDGLGKKVIDKFWDINLLKNHLIFLN